MNNKSNKIQLEVVMNGTQRSVDILVAAIVGMVSVVEVSHEFETIILPLVLDELLRNAIYHGNKADFNKSITLKVAVHNNLMSLEITDEGTGFDYMNFTSDKNEQNPYAGSGRGLNIVKNYSRKMFFVKPGNKICVQLDVCQETSIKSDGL